MDIGTLIEWANERSNKFDDVKEAVINLINSENIDLLIYQNIDILIYVIQQDIMDDMEILME